jgi:hypothetical protein
MNALNVIQKFDIADLAADMCGDVRCRAPQHHRVEAGARSSRPPDYWGMWPASVRRPLEHWWRTQSQSNLSPLANSLLYGRERNREFWETIGEFHARISTRRLARILSYWEHLRSSSSGLARRPAADTEMTMILSTIGVKISLFHRPRDRKNGGT